MLSINFDGLRKDFPHLSVAFDQFGDFLRWNTWIDHIEPGRILARSPNLNAFELGLALSVLVDRGVLRRKFAVIAPNGCFARGISYNSPSEIPETLYDLHDDPFPRDKAPLVAVYEGDYA